jgi:2-oxoglutarate ferredoxin oxidoreductase subunit beta
MKDFKTDQDVRWCPGCGDYAILSTVQKVLPTLGIPKEKFVFISGIGCAARFPYYMNTYGFHSIHGRAPAIATGLNLANPDLSVWVVTGDGDALSIGGNHLLHILRRNVNVNILLFNNRIYGLTKGQTSPTSEMGKKTKSTPIGSIDRPMNPASVAIGANATFFARTVAVQSNHLAATLERAHKHQGTSLIEILQNCNIFNDGCWDDFTERKVRKNNELELKDGEPLIFGSEENKGIRLNGYVPEVVTIGENGVKASDLVVHNETAPAAYAMMLSELAYPDYPTPIGVFRCIETPTYGEQIRSQQSSTRAAGDLQTLVDGSSVWSVD